MAKLKSLSSGFFGNFQTSTDEDNPTSNAQDDDVEETEQEEEDTKEEVVEGEEEVEEQESDEDVEESDSTVDPFIDTINYLSERGLLQYDEDKTYEEEGEELLETVFNETLEKRFQEEYVNTIPEDFQSIIKHIKAGGTLDEWVDAVKPTDFDSINLEDEDTQKQLIEDHLALTGMDEEDIQERIQELEDLGTLEKNAKTAIKYLKKNEDNKVKQYEAELEEAIQQQELQRERELEDFKKTVLSTEDIKGFKLKDKAERQQLFDYITVKDKTGESKYVKDTKAIDSQLALAYMAMKGFTMKDLEKAVETKVTSKLRNSLSRITDSNARNNGGKTGRVNTESKRIPKGPWG